MRAEIDGLIALPAQIAETAAFAGSWTRIDANLRIV
jgi:hypothetical protein